MTPKYIKIEFKGHRRAFYINDMEYPIRPEDRLVVLTDKGEDLGRVTAVMDELCSGCSVLSEFRISRKASDQDLKDYEENSQRETEARETCRRMVKELGLTMKLMDVEYQLDRKKITFYYTADERVDFRELVRRLAGIFRTRIEMRQIGVRDEAKRLCSVGTCGLPLCCGVFIENFEPVNTQFAKDQSLPMNPSKLSGQCGKLKCCLRYEHGLYREAMESFPVPGEPVFYSSKKGYIEKINVLQDKAVCQMEDGSTEEFDRDRVKELVNTARKKGLKNLKYAQAQIVDADAGELNKIEDN